MKRNDIQSLQEALETRAEEKLKQAVRQFPIGSMSYEGINAYGSVEIEGHVFQISIVLQKITDTLVKDNREQWIKDEVTRFLENVEEVENLREGKSADDY